MEISLLKILNKYDSNRFTVENYGGIFTLKDSFSRRAAEIIPLATGVRIRLYDEGRFETFWLEGDKSHCMFMAVRRACTHFKLCNFAAFCARFFCGYSPEIRREYLYRLEYFGGVCVVFHNIKERTIEIIADGETKKLPDYLIGCSSEIISGVFRGAAKD